MATDLKLIAAVRK